MADAQDFLGRFGLEMRVTRIDGRATICTRDVRYDRVNVWVENDIVTEVKDRG